MWSAATYVAPDVCDEDLEAAGSESCPDVVVNKVGGRFKLVGRDEFRALRYRPHALQMIAPCGDRLQSGVRVV